MSNIIFGPIASRRFGKSLGIDLSPNKKQCNFDCVYCELAPRKALDEYQDILDVETILEAVKIGIKEYPDIDVLTVTANGEPTLYPYLETLAKRLKELSKDTELLILSNGSTINQDQTQKALKYFDTVKLSLDCATERCFKRIDRPSKSIDLDDIKNGMLKFANNYQGNLIIEILIVEGINDKASEIESLNNYLSKLSPTRIDLGTIDRPPAYRVLPVPYSKLRELSLLFDPSLSVHITSRRDIANITPSSYSEDEILKTLNKRPLTQNDIEILFDNESQKRLQELQKVGKIGIEKNNGVIFFISC